ncbi:MAG: phosphotransferase, partial [Anaerolineales bacterium]
MNDARVFRFPKNEHAREALAREIMILDLVRRYVEMPVPAFELYDGFVTYPLIPGSAFQQDDLLQQDEPTQDRLAEQIAAFLCQLHT